MARNIIQKSCVRYRQTVGLFVYPTAGDDQHPNDRLDANRGCERMRKTQLYREVLRHIKGRRAEIPDMRITVLRRCEEVTTDQREDHPRPMSPPMRSRPQESMARSEKDAKQDRPATPKVVTLYRAPPLRSLTFTKPLYRCPLWSWPRGQIDFFGGDLITSNTRATNLDVSSSASYENDNPLKTSTFLKVSKDGPQENERNLRRRSYPAAPSAVHDRASKFLRDVYKIA